MTQYVIPLVAVANQTLAVQLGTQSCRINVRQRRTGLFVDLYALASPTDRAICLGVKAYDRNYLVRDAYLNFTGDLFFADTQGTQDPSYDGLADRYALVWDDAA